jgi:magnesium chelatase subunit H
VSLRFRACEVETVRLVMLCIHSQVLQALLKTTDRVVQQIDSVEYGLTDIQVSNTGPLPLPKGPDSSWLSCGCVMCGAFGARVAG